MTSAHVRAVLLAALAALPSAAALAVGALAPGRWQSPPAPLFDARARAAPLTCQLDGGDDEAEAEPELDDPEPAPAPARTPLGVSPCAIKVIGVGGGGGNTLNRMVVEGDGADGYGTYGQPSGDSGAYGADSDSAFLEYVAMNTDIQALASSLAPTRIQLGAGQARGLGAGGIPAIGRSSAIDSAGEIESLVDGADMVFVTAGMGGGTGSGAAPVVAELAKAAGCLTVGIVTKPFSFEGQKRASQAADAIEALQVERPTP